MRPASLREREQLDELFAELCSIASPTGEEGAVAEHVRGLLEGLGLEVEEDDAAAAAQLGAGNLLVRIPGRADRTVLLCAHLDTVGHDGPVVPVLDDGTWRSEGETILGADNKAAVAVMLQAARRWTAEGSAPVGVELLLTVGEERSLAGARAFDASRLRAEVGYVYDQATPIGGVVMASPTMYRLAAAFHGRAAHAGLRPETGSSAIVAAARAIAAMPHGRIDAQSTANVGWVRGGREGTTNVVADRAELLAEVRSLDARRAEEEVARVADACHDAANDPADQVDLDLSVELLFTGYRHRPDAPVVVAAEEALRRCGVEPHPEDSGGGTDGNALMAAGGPAVVCLANGTAANHETTESVSSDALGLMLDVTYALCGVLATG